MSISLSWVKYCLEQLESMHCFIIFFFFISLLRGSLSCLHLGRSEMWTIVWYIVDTFDVSNHLSITLASGCHCYCCSCSSYSCCSWCCHSNIKIRCFLFCLVHPLTRNYSWYILTLLAYLKKYILYALNAIST